MNPAAKPFFVCRNSDLQREVWARWVPAMEYYEIFEGNESEQHSFIGECNFKSEIKAIARDYLNELYEG